MSTYSTFRHLQRITSSGENDWIARLALLDLINQLDVEPSPYLTALESNAFYARVAMAANRDSEEKGAEQGAAESKADVILAALREHITTDNSGDWDEIFNLSIPDMERVIAACKWSKKEHKIMDDGSDGYAELERRPAESISSTFQVQAFAADTPITIEQGGNGAYLVRSRVISKEIGHFYMTRLALTEWGLHIPRHRHLTQSATPTVNIYYPNPPEGVTLIVKSDEAIHKGAQIELRIRKGDNEMQRSISATELKKSGWTFSIEIAADE